MKAWLEAAESDANITLLNFFLAKMHQQDRLGTVRLWAVYQPPQLNYDKLQLAERTLTAFLRWETTLNMIAGGSIDKAFVPEELRPFIRTLRAPSSASAKLIFATASDDKRKHVKASRVRQLIKTVQGNGAQTCETIDISDVLSSTRRARHVVVLADSVDCYSVAQALLASGFKGHLWSARDKKSETAASAGQAVDFWRITPGQRMGIPGPTGFALFIDEATGETAALLSTVSPLAHFQRQSAGAAVNTEVATAVVLGVKLIQLDIRTPNFDLTADMSQLLHFGEACVRARYLALSTYADTTLAPDQVLERDDLWYQLQAKDKRMALLDENNELKADKAHMSWHRHLLKLDGARDTFFIKTKELGDALHWEDGQVALAADSPAGGPCLVLIGRDTRDPAHTQELHRWQVSGLACASIVLDIMLADGIISPDEFEAIKARESREPSNSRNRQHGIASLDPSSIFTTFSLAVSAQMTTTKAGERNITYNLRPKATDSLKTKYGVSEDSRLSFGGTISLIKLSAGGRRAAFFRFTKRGLGVFALPDGKNDLTPISSEQADREGTLIAELTPLYIQVQARLHGGWWALLKELLWKSAPAQIQASQQDVEIEDLKHQRSGKKRIAPEKIHALGLEIAERHSEPAPPRKRSRGEGPGLPLLPEVQEALQTGGSVEEAVAVARGEVDLDVLRDQMAFIQALSPELFTDEADDT
ncbi:uncharacterized protein PFL1_02197 [Pseudozyma flocculosa PF-1]|nr:uncharacterized protein PFL1_02197 [Pseudozyma flocculosa PF-1]EPQ30080.1 hypothetical protein PFL1_02197 [Pseudozyma flocculosa PF-1]